MDGARVWLLTIISASILCALADSLMPSGAVKQVGKLVCGLVLLCAVLSPLAGLNIQDPASLLEEYQLGLEDRQQQLKEQVDEGMKIIIEQDYAAYILDKATQMGLSCTVRVSCRLGEDGLYLPDRVEIAGAFSDVEQSRLTRMVEENLGVALERQTYYSEGELP